MSSIPLVRRLEVAALVCKRWRDAVRRSITHLSRRWTCNRSFPLALLPSITSLEMHANVMRECSTDLKRLTYWDGTRTLDTMEKRLQRELLLRFTLLTHLDVRGTYMRVLECIPDLVVSTVQH